MSIELEVLWTARKMIQQGWCKELARNKTLVWSPQGVWVPDNPKDPQSPEKWVDATAWSLVGALLRAEIILEGGLGTKRWHPMFTTGAHKFLAVAVKARGFNYIADFNDPDRSRATHTQADMLDVLADAIWNASIADTEPKSWPFEQARALLKRVGAKPRMVTFATGYGPSGPPHVGTFAEVVRTQWVRRAFTTLTRGEYPTQLIVFSDDYDAFRRVPDGFPSEMEADLGRPLTSVRSVTPSNGASRQSFGDENNALLRAFVEQICPDYTFVSSTDMYESGAFDEALKSVFENYDAVQAIMLPTLGEERRATYSPFMPLSYRGRLIAEGVRPSDDHEDVLLWADETGDHQSTITGGNAKLQWKVDWAMRWGVLAVDYEMSGKDLIDSVKASSKIARVLGHAPPLGYTYELFLDENGEKISKSKGNGLSMEDWRRYGPLEALSMFMFQNPRAAKNLHLGLIPRVTDEYLKNLTAFQTQTETQRLDNPVWHIHGGDVPEFSSDISYALLLNLASVSNAEDPTVLWEYLSTYRTIPASDEAIVRQLLPLVIAYFGEKVLPTKTTRTPTDPEWLAIDDLRARLSRMENGLDGEAYQFEVYEWGKAWVVKEPATFPALRDTFRMIYEVFFGDESGPRFGTFVSAYGRERAMEMLAAKGRELPGEIGGW